MGCTTAFARKMFEMKLTSQNRMPAHPNASGCGRNTGGAVIPDEPGRDDDADMVRDAHPSATGPILAQEMRTQLSTVKIELRIRVHCVRGPTSHLHSPIMCDQTVGALKIAVLHANVVQVGHTLRRVQKEAVFDRGCHHASLNIVIQNLQQPINKQHVGNESRVLTSISCSTRRNARHGYKSRLLSINPFIKTRNTLLFRILRKVEPVA